MQNYKGMIVEESLIDNRVLNNFQIEKFNITEDENPEDRWHIYTVSVSISQIDDLMTQIKPNWYMHFWKDKDIIAIFADKRFEFNYDDKSTWKDVIEYWLWLWIPKEQLTFVIE